MCMAAGRQFVDAHSGDWIHSGLDIHTPGFEPIHQHSDPQAVLWCSFQQTLCGLDIPTPGFMPPPSLWTPSSFFNTHSAEHWVASICLHLHSSPPHSPQIPQVGSSPQDPSTRPPSHGTHTNRSANMLLLAGQLVIQHTPACPLLCQTIHTTRKPHFKSATVARLSRAALTSPQQQPQGSRVQQTMALMCASSHSQSYGIYKTQMDSLSTILRYWTGFSHGNGYDHTFSHFISPACSISQQHRWKRLQLPSPAFGTYLMKHGGYRRSLDGLNIPGLDSSPPPPQPSSQTPTHLSKIHNASKIPATHHNRVFFRTLFLCSFTIKEM